MYRFVLVAMLSGICVATPGAQEALNTKQRDSDLVQLASIYAKQYAPYEWKRDVHPDIVVDYMTRSNLMAGGGLFVKAFTDAAVKLAQTTPH